ncbi:MAG: indolepyruvate oxidoreductase subunit beta [bacterium]|nr:indolepyruvate oxidoreductase subunit beta [bacterium]
MNKSILLSGVGGQGTVLASRLIAAAAMDRDEQARTAETIGMSQRGGCVVSHVRIGKDIYSSLIPIGKADMIIGFEAGEAVRVFPYLKNGGTVVVNKSIIAPVTASLSDFQYHAENMIAYLKEHAGKVIVVDGEAIAEKCGSSKVLNMALLGAAIASGELGISMAEMETAVKEKVKPAFLEMNRKALSLGAELN